MAILEDWNFVGGSTTGLTNSTTISVTCTTPGTYRNASGVLVFPSANTARIDYDGSGNCLGLLLEQDMSQKSGIVSQTDFTGTGNWTASTGTTVTANQYDGPDGGSSNADKIADANDSTNDTPYIQGFVNPVSSGERYIMSVFLKKIAGNDWAYLRIGNQISSAGYAWFDLANGVVGSTSPGLIRSGIEAYANGWYRCWSALDMTNTSVLCDIGMTDSDEGTSYNSNGSIVAVQYFQLEIADWNDDVACYPTSYTTGNRTDEYCQPDDMDWYDQGVNTGNFSWYTEWDARPDNSSAPYPWTLGTGDGACYMRFGLFDAINQFGRFWALNNPGNDGLSQSLGTFNQNLDINYAAGSLTTDDQRYCLNAGTVGKDITVDYPLSDTVTQAATYFGGASTITAISGHLRALVFVDDFWDDATLTDYATNGYSFQTAFGGTVAGDGGHVWPARANDPRWTQIITDSGITPTGNFQDDVRAALLALSGASRGSPDDLWKKVKAAYGVTDTSEPWLY